MENVVLNAFQGMVIVFMKETENSYPQMLVKLNVFQRERSGKMALAMCVSAEGLR